ncbi:MAG TPA: winged helix-turn-helix domain-containing protein [Actinomycetota bacterium]|nr:winged helix-turn-helix domain-containing protein [Actinomycetota bacterium]
MLAAWPDETYRRNARGLRDRQAFEAVRMQAGTLSAAGRSHAEIAPHPRRGPPERQPLARPLASGWAAGAGEPRANRDRPRLSDQQLHDLDQALRPGARAHGFDTDHWTLVRIATVIERLTGVAYDPGHVWKLLRQSDAMLAAAGPRKRSPPRPSAVSRGFAALIGCPSRFCATVAYRCGEDEQVTVR